MYGIKSIDGKLIVHHSGFNTNIPVYEVVPPIGAEHFSYTGCSLKIGRFAHYLLDLFISNSLRDAINPARIMIENNWFGMQDTYFDEKTTKEVFAIVEKSNSSTRIEMFGRIIESKNKSKQ